MRLRFSYGDDEDAYRAARDVLLDEFSAWLDGTESERAELIGDVGIFLDWRHGYSTGVLDEFDDGDIAEFLLEWCPRKLAVPVDDADGVCHAVGVFVEFMALTGRLVGGVDRATALMMLAEGLASPMRKEMDNPANFGMAKTLTAGLGDISSMSEDELKAALQARIDEYNALPFEERKAVTDQFIDPEPEPYELPFVYIPPPPADVEAAAAAAPLPAKVHTLREYLGPAGRPLTSKGNLKLADGRALIELLDTGDEMDPQIGDKFFRTVSTAQLPQLTLLIKVAKQARAVRVHQRRLVPVKSWSARSPVQQATALFAAVVELGPLQSQSSGRVCLFNELHEWLDGGIVHWLAPMLGPRAEGPFDVIAEYPRAVVVQQMAPLWPEWSTEYLDEFVQHDISRLFQVLELAGVLVWTDRNEVRKSYRWSYSTGGTVGLTAFGRYVLPDYLPDAGFMLHRVDDMADADGTALIDAMLSAPDAQHGSLVAAWQPGRPAIERVQMLTGAITTCGSAKTRLMGFVALDMFDIDVVEPLVRQLLDSPVAGNAAMWLMAHDRADIASLGSFVDIGAMVDVFASNLDDPEALCDLFTAGPDADQPFKLLEGMWRQSTPETALVLDVLGQHLKDRKLAKAARKAAMRHRSWMANRE